MSTRQRTFLLAPMMLAAAGVMTATLVAQTSQDRDTNRQADRQADRQLQNQDRNDRAMRELRQLQQLEGTWDVTVRMNAPHMHKGAGNPDHVIRDDGDDERNPDHIIRDDREDEMAHGGWQLEGTSTREWTLERHVLKETFEVEQARMQRGSAADRGDLSQNQLRNFKGMGLFCYDQEHDKFTHVWTDTVKHGVALSYGSFNPSTNTFTFKPIDHENKSMTAKDGRDLDRDRDLNPDADDDGSRVLGSEERRMKDDAMKKAKGEPTVTLRIIDNNKHIVEMTKWNKQSGAYESYQITYTRQGTDTANRGVRNTRDTNTRTTDR